MEKEFISWEQYEKAVQDLASKIQNDEFWHDGTLKEVYGIPRGGLVVAVSLSHKLNLPLTQAPGKVEETLIVDDICDSGKTFKRYENYKTAVLVYHENKLTKPTFWARPYHGRFVVFPWETESTAKIDYDC